MIGIQKWLDSLIDLLMSGRTSIIVLFQCRPFLSNE